MVKTNKKSLIAMIAMVVLLIASIAMGITGAWFTDKDSKEGKNSLTFGTIVVKVSDDFTAAYKTGTTVVMPGDELQMTGTITNSGEKAHVAYKVVYKVMKDTNDITSTVLGDSATSYGYAELNKNSTIDLSTENVTVPGEDTKNAAQGATLSVSIEVVAVQSANYELTGDTDEAKFTAIKAIQETA